MSLSKPNLQVAPYINVSIIEKEIDTSKGYLTNVTHGERVKVRSLIFHTREGEYDFEYVRNKVNSSSISCRCIYFSRKGVLCKATCNIICEPELIKFEKIGNKKKFSLIDDDIIYEKTKYKFDTSKKSPSIQPFA